MSLEIMDAHNGDRAEVAVPQQNTIRKALKAVKYAIAAVCIISGVLAGAAAQAAIRHKPVRDAAPGTVGTPKYTPLQGIKIGKTVQARVPLQYGKLKLRNDTESGAIVFLHAPGEEKYSRYAYLPACSERDMSAKYSTRWRVSVDAVHAQQIGVVKGGVLMVATSSLVNQPDIMACNRGLRLQSQRIVATLTNRPQDYANISQATYRPVVVNNLQYLLVTRPQEVMQNVSTRTSPQALESLPQEKQMAVLNAQERWVDSEMLMMSANVLRIPSRKVNAVDDKKLIEVARYLKGNGSPLNVEKASVRLNQYIVDCYQVFAGQPQALQFLKNLRTYENLKTNLQAKASSFPPSGTGTPNTSQHIKFPYELNDTIVAAPPGQQQYSKIDGGIKCVQDKPSVTTHPSSTI